MKFVSWNLQLSSFSEETGLFPMDFSRSQRNAHSLRRPGFSDGIPAQGPPSSEPVKPSVLEIDNL